MALKYEVLVIKIFCLADWLHRLITGQCSDYVQSDWWNQRKSSLFCNFKYKVELFPKTHFYIVSQICWCFEFNVSVWWLFYCYQNAYLTTWNQNDTLNLSLWFTSQWIDMHIFFYSRVKHGMVWGVKHELSIETAP